MMQRNDSNSVFSSVWNLKKDTLYVCVGPSFSTSSAVEIAAIMRVSQQNRTFKKLTQKRFNSAFPSNSPDGIHFLPYLYIIIKCKNKRTSIQFIDESSPFPKVKFNLHKKK